MPHPSPNALSEHLHASTVLCLYPSALPQPSKQAMAPQFPSIQSFFEKEPSPRRSKDVNSDPQAAMSDGFTDAEVEATIHPKLHKWQPHVEYENMDIGSLSPGPGCVALVGRVVNFYDQSTPSKRPQAAKGCFKVIVKDDTGAMMVMFIDRKRATPS